MAGRTPVTAGVLLCLLACQGAVEGGMQAGGNPAAPGPMPGSATGGVSQTPTTASGGSTPTPTGSGGAATATGGSTVAMAGSSATPTTGGTPGVEDPATICAQMAGTLQVGMTRLRRITRSELNHTLRDLLNVVGTPADALSPDESIGPFHSNAIAPVDNLLVQQHDEIATALAAEAESRMGTIAPCDLTADTGTGCATQFVEDFGLRAYRRPLDATERDDYVAMFTAERDRAGVQKAFSAVVETMLQSPFFLYHTDVGQSGVPSATPVALSSYEMASRLSYFLWNSMPDTALFTQAAANALQDPAVLATEVQRMLSHEHAKDSIPLFHLRWLGVGELEGLTKDTQRYPLWNVELAAAARNETAAFTDFVVRSGDGLLGTLLTGGFSFLEGPLFQLYGVAQPAGYVPGTQVTLNPAERAGILTQAAFLATHAHADQTSPVHRGILVRENLLCHPLDPPPPDVNNVAPAVTPATTTRERFANHSADVRCAGCHTLIDPIGLTFENYDPIGAYRTMDGPQEVDASGELTGAGDDVAGAFIGAVELSRKLAGSSVVKECVANQWFRYALGRMESNDDACSLQAIHDSFTASGGNIRQLLADIVKSDAFRNVRATGGAQ